MPEIKLESRYWNNVCAMAEKQRAKGMATYGKGLEANRAEILTRIEYLQEELIDALMYCEWIKESIKPKVVPYEIGDTIRIPLPKDKKIMTYNGEEIDFDYNAEDE